MRYILYEHQVTDKFALICLPHRFADDDKLPILPTERWFDNPRRPSRHSRTC